jgi:hypothetical protein
MKRRDAAVLLFVAAGIYCLMGSLSFLSALIELFGPQVTFPSDYMPAVAFASYLVPFGLLFAGGQFLIRGRQALADQLFDQNEALPTSHGQTARVQAVGALALAALGLLCFFKAVGELIAVIQLAQPYTWHSTSAARIIMVSVLHPVLLFAYLWLGWWLVSRRESLATRWLIPEEAASKQLDSQSQHWEAVTFRVVGLYFVMVALVPLSRAFVSLVAAGRAVTANTWGFWPDAITGTIQLLFGVGVFVGRKGLVSAWQRFVDLRAR